MKKSTLLLALAVAGLLTSSASAQLFVGSDDFSNAGVTDAKWAYFFRFSGTNGLMDYSAGRLDFTKGAGAGSFVLGWDGDPTSPGANPSKTSASYSTSWVADVVVTNTLTGVGGSDFAVMGLEVAGASAQYSGIMLSANSSGYTFRAEGTGFTPVNVAAADSTDVHLRLTWDANSQLLNSYYSFDGSSYTSLATYNPTSEWLASSATGGFNFEVFGNSNIAGNITTGSMYASSFSVSAVPEPSTYAAFAGLGALGLAMWRRRQARALAKA